MTDGARLFRILRFSASAGLVGAITVAAPCAAMDLADRVLAHEQILLVYRGHQLGTPPAPDEAVPRAVVEARALRSLQLTELLAERWNVRIDDAALERELQRIARDTRMPERLRELYAALDRDPVRIKETLVRSVLVERLARSRFASDPVIHAPTRARAELLARVVADGRTLPATPHETRTLVELIRVEGEVSPLPPKLSDVLDDLPGAGVDVGLPWELAPHDYARERGRAPARVGEVGPPTPVRDAYELRVVLAEQPDRATIAIYRVPKISWDAWWAEARAAYDGSTVGVVAEPDAALPPPGGAGRDAAVGFDGACVPDDSWSPTSTIHDPERRTGHSAVWTGSEMIVWSDDTGERYDPTTDSWTPVSTLGAPARRNRHAAVWSGSVMVVWGGRGVFNTPLDDGGRYDPLTDTWSPMSQSFAPEARYDHTAVWIGTRMLVFGGLDADSRSLGTGGAYDPVGDSWLPLPPNDARHDHSVVWTGTHMIVWGGRRTSLSGTEFLDGGSRYNPVTASWSDTTQVGAPAARSGHSAIWTGSRMIVFGGAGQNNVPVNDGGSYDPAGDTWTPLDTAGAPPGRRDHAAVWTGSDMVVWGGEAQGNQSINGGARYDPATDTWIPTSGAGEPPPAQEMTVVWTGDQMIVWGGLDLVNDATNAGGRYDPASDTWLPTQLTTAAPNGRRFFVSAWTGNEMIVWGGDAYPNTFDTGARYDPTLDVWLPTSLIGAPMARTQTQGAWTAGRLIVWGGFATPDATDTGGRYDPLTDSWQPTTTTNAPLARFDATAVAADGVMIVWGGDTDLQFPGELNSGGVYDPAADTWQPTQLGDAPSPRVEHTAVWTGNEMIVWGGYLDSGNGQYNTGGMYRPQYDDWRLTDVLTYEGETIKGRKKHTAVWTGSEMIVWGGDIYEIAGEGAAYDPVLNAWREISSVGAPVGRTTHTAVWTGALMVVWGGLRNQVPVFDVDGGRYDPVRDSWTATSLSGPPEPRAGHRSVWSGNEMIAWGGGSDLGTGGNYYPADLDVDGVSDACDCAPADGSASDLDEVGGLGFEDAVTLRWTSANPQFGSGTTHDVLRGPLDGLPVGAGATEQCVADGITDSSLADSAVPGVGAGFWYLVRATNACGLGTYGAGAAGERLSGACP